FEDQSDVEIMTRASPAVLAGISILNPALDSHQQQAVGKGKVRARVLSRRRLPRRNGPVSASRWRPNTRNNVFPTEFSDTSPSLDTSALKRYAPSARSMKSGAPPTALHARAGEFTTPEIFCSGTLEELLGIFWKSSRAPCSAR